MSVIKKLFFIIVLGNPLLVYADTNKLSCSAKHLNSNEQVEVKIASAYVGNKVATAQWPEGHPTIVIDDSKFVKLPINVRQFIYYHECAHLQLKTEDEFIADCHSVDTLINKHDYSERDIRKLVKVLVKEFGMSLRWSSLLDCSKVFE